MKHYILLLFQNYFWILAISSVISILFGNMWLFTFSMPIMLFFLAWKPKRSKKNLFDVLMVLVFVSIIISWCINSYSFRSVLIFRFVITQGAFMAAYYIGRNMEVDVIYKVFRNALFPGLICAVLGLALYIYQPAWYIANIDNPASLESFRLRSIFSSPYVLSYMSFFLLSYLLALDFKVFPAFNKIEPVTFRIRVLSYVLFSSILLFCMMRAPIGGVLISLFIALFHTAFVRKKIHVLIYAIVAMIALCVVAWNIMQRYMDIDSMLFLLEKFEMATDSSGDFYEARANLFVADDTLWGDGAGRHAFYVEQYKMESIRDTCYQRLLQEVGYVGLTLHLLLFGCIIIKCVRYHRYLGFELSVMIFLLLSMIGAEPLATPDKHCFFYWLIMGRVSSFRLPKKKII
ncbi:hypothetical protein [uncultured Phocaeicola sp.]|uniref:hypothetical protein n=1 Tax=uncultured Phocaeicola sp. TaxID=990718 RepID=UPI0026395C36|nr:hypothetical protein [uncultured Phocaeicola sp.]